MNRSAPLDTSTKVSNSTFGKKDKQAQKEVESMFSEMIGWAVDEGADMLIGEKAFKALEVMKKANFSTLFPWVRIK